MEKITGIYTHFKERFANPLIFSFFCSWLIINWEVVVAVMWHDVNQIKFEGSNTIFEFVKIKTNKCDGLIYPIVSALIYTIAIPFVRAGITALQASASRLSEKWEIGILGGSKISMDKYLGIREEYIKRTKILEEEIEKENEHKTNFDKIKTQYLQLELDINGYKLKETASGKEIGILKETIIELNNFKPRPSDDITVAFNETDDWQNYFILPDGEEGWEYFNTSKDGFILKDGTKYNVENIKITPDGKILSFDKIINNTPHPNFLIRDNELNYHGIEDEKTLITYRKKVQPYIEIISAKYYYDKNYIDIKSKLQKFVDNGETRFTPTNVVMGGDPFYLKPKKVEVTYKMNGKYSTLTGTEESVFKFV